MSKVTFNTTAQQGKYWLTDIEGVIIKSQAITTAKTTIEHNLGKDINGWIVIKKNTDAIIYEDSRNRRNLYLKSDKDVTADILII